MNHGVDSNVSVLRVRIEISVVTCLVTNRSG